MIINRPGVIFLIFIQLDLAEYGGLDKIKSNWIKCLTIKFGLILKHGAHGSGFNNILYI